MRRTTWIAADVLAVLAMSLVSLITAACDVDDVNSLDNTSLGVLSFGIDTRVQRPAEDLMLGIAQDFSSLAGYYCSQGELVVGVVGGVGNNDALKQRISSEGIASACRSRLYSDAEPQIRIIDAKNRFLTLRAWRDSIADLVFEYGFVHGIGIDYEANKLVLSVDPGAAQSGLELLDSYGIPAEGANVVESERPKITIGNAVACPSPPYNGLSLQSCFRPIPGGVQISMANQGGSTYIGPCTLTLGVKRGGLDGWITAEHCVPPIGAMDFDYIYQPSWDTNRYTAEPARMDLWLLSV